MGTRKLMAWIIIIETLIILGLLRRISKLEKLTRL